jgi:hypothetical protein
VPALAFPLGERLVGDVADQVLEEPVLPALGRARVGLHAQHLLTHQPGQQRLELLGGCAGQAGQRADGERLAEHGSVLEEAALFGRDAVQARSDQCMQRLGHLERLDLARGLVDRPLLGKEAPVEEHSHRLDGIQRHALRAREDLRAQPLRQARHETLEQLLHRTL